MITHSKELDSLADALIVAVSSMAPAIRDSENYFKRKYADLGSLIAVSKQHLLEAGLILTQHPHAEIVSTGDSQTPPVAVAGCETMIIHASTGQWLKSVLLLPCEALDPQKAGSAITYAKRYTLESILSIPSVDDDAELVMQRDKKVQQQAQSSDKTMQELKDVYNSLVAEIDKISDVKSLNAFYKSQIETLEVSDDIKKNLIQKCTARKEEIEKGN
jgi:hypothetical protein